MNQKEAAVQRLAAAFRAASTLPIMGEPIEAPDLDELARIAIEQAVVPAFRHRKWSETGVWRDEKDCAIPWAAVCAEVKP